MGALESRHTICEGKELRAMMYEYEREAEGSSEMMSKQQPNSTVLFV